MFRRSLHILALSAVAALAAASPAAAGSCCACVPDCPPAEFIPVLELPEVTPIYVVNEGPIYTGPGIMSLPTTFKVRTSLDAYPYVGYRSHKHWHRPRVVHYHPRGPRRMVRPPLDPRDK